jgi:hypothetical protein
VHDDLVAARRDVRVDGGTGVVGGVQVGRQGAEDLVAGVGIDVAGRN